MSKKMVKKKMSKRAKIGISFAVVTPLVATAAIVAVTVAKAANPDPNRDRCISDDYFIIDESTKTLIGFKEGVDISKFNTLKIPSKCVNVAENAFKDKLNSLTNISKIIIPKTCKNIGVNAFAGCTNVSKIIASDVNYTELTVGYNTTTLEGIFGKTEEIEADGWYCNVVLPSDELGTGLKNKLIANGAPSYWFGVVTEGNAIVISQKEQECSTITTKTVFEIQSPKPTNNVTYKAVASRTSGTAGVGIKFTECNISADGKTLTVNSEIVTEAGHEITSGDYVEYKITIYSKNVDTGETWLQEFTGFKSVYNYVDITGVEIQQSDVTIYTNNYYQLNAAPIPANASDSEIEWSSSDPETVQVVDGLLIAKKVTTDTPVTITAKSVAKPSLTDTCSITVKNWDTDGYAVIALHNISETETSTFKVPKVAGWDGKMYYSTDYAYPTGDKSNADPSEAEFHDLSDMLGKEIKVSPGKYLLLRGTNNHRLSATYNEQYSGYEPRPWVFSGGQMSIKGNILDLFNYADHDKVSIYPYACYNLFKDSNIVGVSQNYLADITTLVPYIYWGMFKGCDKLIAAPNLPATILASGCYTEMFDGCSELRWAPELNATRRLKLTLVDKEWKLTDEEGVSYYCYRSMFRNCYSLQDAPELPATTLGVGCYETMFYGCKSLITAPTLPATTLANGCYYSMFQNCRKLKITTDATAGSKTVFACPDNVGSYLNSVNNMFTYTFNYEQVVTPQKGETFYLEKTE